MEKHNLNKKPLKPNIQINNNNFNNFKKIESTKKTKNIKKNVFATVNNTNVNRTEGNSESKSDISIISYIPKKTNYYYNSKYIK